MTHLVSQKNAVGNQSSRTGISTTGSELNEEQIDRGLEWLRRLPQLPRDQLPAKADVERVSGKLLVPTDPIWCLARVAALLLPYYEKDTPQAVREMEAEDWREALGGFPRWAIERAVRWWKSDANPDRRKRPLEGDIAARCRVEMNGVPSAVQMLELRRTGRDFSQPQLPRERISAERAAEILAEAGLSPQRMPKE